MRILYGVQGTGNGHISRARAMAEAFRELDVEVDYLFSGRDPERYFDMQAFGQYQCRDGLTFAAGNGRVRFLATLKNNRLGRFWKDVSELDLSPYDLLLTDFEPVTAWAGRLQKKRVIGLGHQYAFHHAVPQHASSILQRAIIRHFAPVDIALGLHWHQFGQEILPPIAPVGNAHGEVQAGQYLVYLPFESVEDVNALLRHFPGYQFCSYHPEATPGQHGHVNWHRPDREGFLRALHEAEGVICNAGFELASEVLQLGRKLLVKPLAGQSEQLSNALALSMLGYAGTMRTLDSARLGNWFASGRSVRLEYPDVAAAVARWLKDGATASVRDLADRLWSESVLP